MLGIQRVYYSALKIIKSIKSTWTWTVLYIRKLSHKKEAQPPCEAGPFHYSHFTDEDIKAPAEVTYPKISDRAGAHTPGNDHKPQPHAGWLHCGAWLQESAKGEDLLRTYHMRSSGQGVKHGKQSRRSPCPQEAPGQLLSRRACGVVMSDSLWSLRPVPTATLQYAALLGGWCF